jgi:hypothetical protein
MKVGDLVTMIGEHHRECDDKLALGVVVDLGNDVEAEGRTRRIGILWNDGDRVDWEPEQWLEAISESR